MADYGEWPLWGRNGLLSADALPLTDATKQRMRAWQNAYNGGSRDDWPLWTAPDGVGDEDEQAWVAEGKALRDVVQRDLGERYRVVFEA
jgi:hypothetical protein